MKKKLILWSFAIFGLLSIANAQNINKIEYFIDADPGYGAGTDVPITTTSPVTANFNVAVGSIADGFHILSIRARDVNGNWGIVGIRPFYKETLSTAAAPNIVAMEYFIDADPGYGAGTAIPVVANTPVLKDINIDLTSVSNGSHKLTIRSKDVNNRWGIVSIQDFIRQDNIIALGYTPARWCISTNFNIPLTIAGTFNAGNIFTAQLSDTNGSFASPTTIGTLPSTTSGIITATLPNNIGVGKGYKIRVVASNPNTIVSIERPFEVTAQCCPDAPVITKSNSNAICVGASATLTANNCNGTVTWSTGANGTTLVVSPNTTTSYTATCTANSCTSSNSLVQIIEVVPQPSIPTVTPPQTTSVCSPNTITLTATCSNSSLVWSNGATTSSIALSAVGTYSISAVCSVNGCNSQTSSPISLEIKQKPTIPSVDNGNSVLVACTPTPAILAATCLVGTPIWSNGSTGNPISISAVGQYTIGITCLLNGCSSDATVSINATVKQTPLAPTLTGQKFGNTITKVWDKRFGGSGEEGLYDILKNADGSFMLTGFTTSGQGSDVSETARGNEDFWAVKIDASGNKLWDKRVGGSGVDVARRIFYNTVDGNSYTMFGYSNSPLSGDKDQPSIGGFDFWGVSISSTGALGWRSRHGGSGDEVVYDVVQNTDGSFLVGGRSNSPRDNSEITQDARGLEDMFIMKIDPYGARVWDKRYGGPQSDHAYRILQTSDGGYLLGGTSNSTANGDVTQAGFGGYDFWLVKINSTGTQIWDKRYGGSGNEAIRFITTTSDGGYILGGESDSGVSGNKTAASKGGRDFWIIKIDASGTMVWDKSFGGSANEEPYRIVQSSDGQYIISGLSSSGVSGDKTEALRGVYDFWSIKINSSGVKTWDKTYGGAGDDEAYGFVIANDNGYLMGGNSASAISGDRTQDTRGGNDFWVTKFTDNEPLTNTVYCSAPNIGITSSGCNGTINWSTGATTQNITVTPNTTTTYTATCTENGCPSVNSSVTVSVVSNTINLTGNATAGIQQASQTITSTQIVNSGINSNYRAGSSISLNNGFNAQNGSVFKAEIVGCTN